MERAYDPPPTPAARFEGARRTDRDATPLPGALSRRGPAEGLEFGAGFQHANAEAGTGSGDRRPASPGPYAVARAGLGARVWLAPGRFAMHPEVSAARPFAGPASTWYPAGVGFAFLERFPGWLRLPAGGGPAV